MSGLVRVTRLSRLLDRYRRWDVVLDGETAGVVANGGIAEMLVDSGPHTLRVGHRWWASPTLPFTVKNLQTLEFVCRPRAHPMVWIPYGVASLYQRDLFIVLAPMPPTGPRPGVARHEVKAGKVESLWMDG